MAEVKNKSKTGESKFSSKPLFSWKSPEFVSHKRNPRWYLVTVIVAVVIGSILAWQKLWSGAILVGVALLVLSVLSRLKPRVLECSLYPEGIVVDKRAYQYNQFKHFWFTLSDIPKVKLQLSGRFAGQVTLPLAGADPEQTVAYLSKHLPEEADQGEDLVDVINRLFRL